MELSSSTETFSGALVGGHEDGPLPRTRALAIRAASGLGLSALYGLAIGARAGGDGFLYHALGVPAGALAVAFVAVPALFIILTLFDAPIDPSRLAAEAARSLATFGVVLAGLAPAAALFAVTSGADITASVIAAIGLAVGGGLALRGLTAALRHELESADSATSLLARGVSMGFVLFAIALSARIWLATLPTLGGAS